MNIRSKLFWLYVGLAITYGLINLLAAPPRTTLQHYHITSSSLRLLDASVVGPIILIWFIGLYGFQKLRTYTAYIRNNKDGQHIASLTKGLLFLALWLPINSTTSSILNLLAQHHHSLAAIVAITVNYLGLLLPLTAFVYISKGARGLSEFVRQRPAWHAMNIMTILLILIGVFYCYVVVNARGLVGVIYHMHISLVLLTIVVPYIFSWYLGLVAAFELHLYTYKVRGIIYKRSWNYVAFGVSWIILFSIALQYVTVVTAKFSNLPLWGLLTLIYGVIAVLAIGYIFVALGAKKLTKIEEV